MQHHSHHSFPLFAAMQRVQGKNRRHHNTKQLHAHAMLISRWSKPRHSCDPACMLCNNERTTTGEEWRRARLPAFAAAPCQLGSRVLQCGAMHQQARQAGPLHKFKRSSTLTHTQLNTQLPASSSARGNQLACHHTPRLHNTQIAARPIQMCSSGALAAGRACAHACQPPHALPCKREHGAHGCAPQKQRSPYVCVQTCKRDAATARGKQSLCPAVAGKCSNAVRAVMCAAAAAAGKIQMPHSYTTQAAAGLNVCTLRHIHTHCTITQPRPLPHRHHCLGTCRAYMHSNSSTLRPATTARAHRCIPCCCCYT